ncbi:MAG: enoyl-CoA hydratase family protein [Aquihabitans sp.]
MAASEGELVHLQVDRGIATLTLDSPANRNALSAQLVGELMAHLQSSADDADIRAVVLTHTGTTFCAGADLAESAREGGPGQGTIRMTALLRQILELPTPVVALVQGNVRAGGLGVLGACDLVVAGPTSTFAFTEVRLGVAPAIISLTVLPRLTDRAAARYFLTGEKFDAAEAARIGLLTEASEDFEAAVAVVLEAFRSCSPQGLAESKRLTTAALLEGFDESAQELAALSARLFASPEAQEGITAFLERRPPAWVPSND